MAQKKKALKKTATAQTKKSVPKFVKDLAKKFKTPKKVQEWIHSLSYNWADTVYSGKTVIHKKKAHCLEGALAAALILEQHGYPPLVMSFESADDVDHVVFVFKKGKYWGAVGQSRDPGLYGRKPKFKTLRSLAWSYFDPYIDDSGKITAYQIENLNNILADWRYSSKNLYEVDKHLVDLPHRKMKSSKKRHKTFKIRHQKNGPLKKGPHWW